MYDFDIFLIGLMIVSGYTALITEAIKKVMSERRVRIRAGIASGVVSAALTVAIGASYIAFMEIGFTKRSVACLVALFLFGWLFAMVGYDKFAEVFKSNKKDDD